MRIDKIVVGQLDVNCYLVSDESSSEAIIIDPGDEFERISDLIDSKGIKPEYIVFTHAHYDHVCAARELKDKYGAIVIMHDNELTIYNLTRELCISWGYEPDDFPPPDRTVKDGDDISAGKTVLKVIHSPGHTPGSICLYGGETLFTGDTLFAGSAGRTDLPGGNTEELFRSLKKIISLPPDTEVMCGHGDETTIAREIRHNQFVHHAKYA
ncbi:MAG: MBL fold metallo-hydrolase [Nitrospirota bacterium]